MESQTAAAELGTAELELGLDTFGDVTAEADGTLISGAQTLRNLLEQAVLADEVGVDFLLSLIHI